MAVERQYLSDLERICHEEWDKESKSRCAKLVEMCPRGLVVVMAANWASKKY